MARKTTRNAVEAALREAMVRISSLEADAEPWRPELRFAYRSGHATARSGARTVLNRMIESLE